MMLKPRTPMESVHSNSITLDAPVPRRRAGFWAGFLVVVASGALFVTRPRWQPVLLATAAPPPPQPVAAAPPPSETHSAEPAKTHAAINKPVASTKASASATAKKPVPSAKPATGKPHR